MFSCFILFSYNLILPTWCILRRECFRGFVINAYICLLFEMTVMDIITSLPFPHFTLVYFADFHSPVFVLYVHF